MVGADLTAGFSSSGGLVMPFGAVKVVVWQVNLPPQNTLFGKKTVVKGD